MNNLSVFGMRTIAINGSIVYVVKVAFNNTVDNIEIINSILKKYDTSGLVKLYTTSRNKLCLEFLTTDINKYIDGCEIINTVRVAVKTNNLTLEVKNIKTKLNKHLFEQH
jgi:hypothetical protein